MSPAISSDFLVSIPICMSFVLSAYLDVLAMNSITMYKIELWERTFLSYFRSNSPHRPDNVLNFSADFSHFSSARVIIPIGIVTCKAIILYLLCMHCAVFAGGWNFFLREPKLRYACINTRPYFPFPMLLMWFCYSCSLEVFQLLASLHNHFQIILPTYCACWLSRRLPQCPFSC